MLSGLFGNSTATTNSIPINNEVSFNIPGKSPVNATLTGNLTVSVPASKLNNTTTKIPARLSTGEMTITTGGAGRPPGPVVVKLSPAGQAAANQRARANLFSGVNERRRAAEEAAAARAASLQTIPSPLGPVYKGTVPVVKPRERIVFKSNYLRGEEAKEQRRAAAAMARSPFNAAANFAASKGLSSNHNALARATNNAGELGSRATNAMKADVKRLNLASTQANDFLKKAGEALEVARAKEADLQTRYAIFKRNYIKATQKNPVNTIEVSEFADEEESFEDAVTSAVDEANEAQAKFDQAERDVVKARDALKQYIKVTAFKKQLDPKSVLHPLARGGRKSRKGRKNRKTRKN